jgi:hypothetical protein
MTIYNEVFLCPPCPFSLYTIIENVYIHFIFSIFEHPFYYFRFEHLCLLVIKHSII